MSAPEWRVRVNRKGRVLKRATFKFSIPFLRALEQRAAEESAKHEAIVSQAVILETLALAGDERLQKLHAQQSQRSGT